MNLEFEVLGQGHIAIVVETALCSCYAEWRTIVQSLSGKYTVFLYNRAGYGSSEKSAGERTPKAIATQLHGCLKATIPDKKYLFIGHSLGGLYVQQYIRDYPQNVIGAIFLDPATSEEYRFKEELSSREYKQSGVDKSLMLKMGILLGRLGLLKLFKPALKKAIPFYYFAGYSREDTRAILKHMTQLKTYTSAMAEYKSYQRQEHVAMQLSSHSYPDIPVRVLYHNPQIMIEEIVKFGGLTQADATKIDNLWKDIIQAHYVKLSENYKFEIAENSGHYIHLTDREKLYRVIEEVSTQK